MTDARYNLTDRNRYNYSFDPEGDDWAARLLRQVPDGADVLELGPGPGAMTRVLVARGHSVTAVENDPSAIAELTAMGAEVLACDLNGADWANRLEGRRFGAILACDVLEHLNQPEVVLVHLRNLAAPAAPVIVSVPNVAYAGLIAGLQLGQFEYADTGLLDRTHVRFFTRANLTQTLVATGWAPEHWESYRLPVEKSEFVWVWQQLGHAQRQALIAGSADFDTYEWMMVATPMADAATARAVSTERELSRLKTQYHALVQVHDDEHASLLEHQKAFSEARTTIAAKDEEIRQLAVTASELRDHQGVLSAELAERDGLLQARALEVNALHESIAALREQGWSGKLRRLVDALRR